MRHSINQVTALRALSRPQEILVLPVIKVKTSKDNNRAASLFRKSYYNSPFTSTACSESCSTDSKDAADACDLEERFLKAVSHDDLNDVKTCLDANVDVHVQNGFKRDAMQIAARNGSIPMLELLSLNGGSITTKGIIGDSLFQLAASNGHLAAIKWLNRNGLVEVPDTTGNTAVHVAARRVEPDILRYLDLDMGCCFVQANDEGQTPEDCIPRRFVEMEKLDKCRELVKNTVIEAGRRESEEELAAFNRKAPGHHLSSNSRELDYFKAGLNQR